MLFFFVRTGRRRNIRPEFKSNLSDESKRSLEKASLFMWVVIFVLGLSLTIITNGFSVLYILTFGVLGNADQYDLSTTSLSFIIQFTRCIVPTYLVFLSVSRKKVLKVVLFILTLGLETIRGFRYMLVILVCSVFYYLYLSRNKKVNPVRLIAVLVILFILFGVIEYGRNSVRAGGGLYLEGFSINAVIKAIVGNFGIYSAYYGVIKVVPSIVPYMFFDQMLFYTIILVIPRAFWPGKPDLPGRRAIEIGMNRQALVSGYAYPCIGEYYYSFGVPGVALIMGALGWWLASLENKFRLKAQNELELAMYCVIVPTMLQILIRGYTPTNCFLIIAMFFPYWVLNAYLKRHEKKRNSA